MELFYIRRVFFRVCVFVCVMKQEGPVVGETKMSKGEWFVGLIEGRRTKFSILMLCLVHDVVIFSRDRVQEAEKVLTETES